MDENGGGAGVGAMRAMRKAVACNSIFMGAAPEVVTPARRAVRKLGETLQAMAQSEICKRFFRFRAV
jgi:hypothetical protein